MEFVVDGGGQRLDRWLASQVARLSRSRLQHLIEAGHVLVNDRSAQPSLRVRSGDRVVLTVPPPVTPPHLAPEAIPLPVVYEDRDILVVDKPPGLPVHPAAGHPSRTLVNALLAHCRDLSGIGGVLRPGIVHRLDKDTSGLMVVAKHDAAHACLAQQIKDRQVRKGYLALVWGVPHPPEGTVDAPIGRDPRNRKRMAVVLGGRPARTTYRVLNRYWDASLVEVLPETGRTHQVRVHLASIGHPLVGDALYGKRKTTLVARQFLHAHRLGFRLPSDSGWVEFTSPLPADLARAVALLESGQRAASG
ncbi:MAG: RluA family pseudouridine synthase [Chloroflexi bacterium]|nr:RluA family pseudouridine synthase [Chloroflexota bacterium]